MIVLGGNLFNEGVARWDFFAEFCICEYHLIESVPEHGSAVFEVFAFGYHFRPLEELAHIASGNLGVFGSIVIKNLQVFCQS
jgi:hypothetical protein